MKKQLPGQACQDATGPACPSLREEESKGDSSRELADRSSGDEPPASRHT